MKILVLAGGSDQIALITELKKRGHEIVLLDYFENPPAKNYADKHIKASTLDIDVDLDIAKTEKVNLICTACTDQALLTVAYVSERLGLPCYISYQTALNVTNKSYMKKVLEENSIPTSHFTVIENSDLSVLKDFKFPLVVKPVDCNSSKGVKRIEDVTEFEKYAKEAILFSRTHTAIVEEFKDGQEISADFYIDHGMAKFLSATSSLKIKNRKSFTILCSNYPAINYEQEIALTNIASKIAKAFLLDNTPLLIQFIVNDEEINVIEFSARMGGGSKYKLIEVLSGVNIMSKYVDLILGEKPSVNPSRQIDYCKMVYVYCKPGIYDHAEGLKELKDNGIIDDFFLYKSSGMEITGAETSSDRPAGYLITGTSKEELQRKLLLADSIIKIISKSGNDIMIHNLLR